MQNITSADGLKDAIQLLEADYVIKEHLLRDQIYLTYESLKPAILIRNTLKKIYSSPNLPDNISGAAIRLASGFLSKKIFVGASGYLILKLIGYVLPFGVANVVAQNSKVIRFFGQAIFHHFLRKKELNAERRAR